MWPRVYRMALRFFKARGGIVELRCVELPFFDFVCQLNSAQRYLRIPECLKSQHRITSLLHLPVILFNYVIQVLVGSDERLSGRDAFGHQFGDGLMRRPTAVERDLLRTHRKTVVCTTVTPRSAIRSHTSR